MTVRLHDKNILRNLAEQVAEIAALPAQQDAITLWKALNGLKPARPMVAIDQVCWNEMEVEDELTPQSEDPFCQDLEVGLRRTIYSWRHMPVDMVVEPVVEIPKVIHGESFGPQIIARKAVTDPRNDVIGHAYLDQLKTEEDLQIIHTPRISYDERATAAIEEKACDIFDGILEVRMQGRFPSFAPWDIIVQWHNPEQSILDLIDRPEFMHQIISRLTDAYLYLLDQLEEQGLLGYGQRTVHCTGAYTDELPAAGFDPNRPRAKDLWTHGMAQVFSTVSPAMHKEFWLDYAQKWYARFGLGYYGCCEPLHNKVDIIREVPHIRKISMSPWVEVASGAERIGPDFVYSCKPNPAFLAGSWDPGRVAQNLRSIRDACDRHDCPLEFIMKDISTVCYQPQRLWEWAKIAMQVVTE